MSSKFTMTRPLSGARFGGRVAFAGGGYAKAFVEAAEAETYAGEKRSWVAA